MARVGAFTVVLTLANLAILSVMATTLGTEIGWGRRHHEIAYLVLAAAALAAYPLLRRRRVASVLLACFGAWSLITGLYLVYVTPHTGHGRWMRWWHGVTSVAFLLAFLAHWARNNARLVGLARRVAARPVVAIAFLAAWGALIGFGGASAWTEVGSAFTDENFMVLSTIALSLAVLGVEYAIIARRVPPIRERLGRAVARNEARGAVDASLFAAVWLSALTGFALLYLTRALRSVDAYWLAAWWHVATSALLAALIGAHLLFNARFLRAHARRLDRDFSLPRP